MLRAILLNLFILCTIFKSDLSLLQLEADPSLRRLFKLKPGLRKEILLKLVQNKVHGSRWTLPGRSVRLSKLLWFLLI